MAIERAMIAAVALYALALAGCKAPAPRAAEGAKTDDSAAQLAAAFDKSFNESYAKRALDSCMKSATDSGAAAELAERYCTCFVDRLKPLSVQEKMNLKPESEAVQQAQAACKAKVE